MGETITIALKTPIKGPNNLVVTAVVVREPMYDDVIELGDPYMIAVTASKVPFQVENSEVIRAYLERCVVEPSDPTLLKQVNGRTAIEIKDRFLAFFQPDAPASAE